VAFFAVEADFALRSISLDRRAIGESEAQRFLRVEAKVAPYVLRQQGIARAAIDEKLDGSRFVIGTSDGRVDEGQAIDFSTLSKILARVARGMQRHAMPSGLGVRVYCTKRVSIDARSTSLP
jgi:hypothetical protein